MAVLIAGHNVEIASCDCGDWFIMPGEDYLLFRHEEAHVLARDHMIKGGMTSVAHYTPPLIMGSPW